MNAWQNLIRETEPDLRTIEEIRQVLAFPDCQYTSPLYMMYRDLAPDKNSHMWLRDHHLRYDITRIPAASLCGEYVKTKGHYHPSTPDGSSYPEIYEVFTGTALYLIQKTDFSSVILIRAEKGNTVIIPPGYGHVTINPTKQELVMANIVSDRFSSSYAEYETMRGAAYYLYDNGTIQKNPSYPAIPPLQRRNADDIHVPDTLPDRSLLEYIGDLNHLAFLNEPHNYPELLTLFS
jgi:glucose-6-phosphate isomerase, archaeal